MVNLPVDSKPRAYRRYWSHCIAWIAGVALALASLYMAVTTANRFTVALDRLESKAVTTANRFTVALDRLESKIEGVGRKLPFHDRAQLRLQIIRQQLEQACQGGILIIGDSIVEGCQLWPVCDRLVVNGGIGGIGVKFLAGHVDDILTCGDPGLVVIAIGVNDTALVDGFPTSADRKKWRHLYEELVGRIEKRGVEIILTTILPIEKDKALGTKYFDFRMIEKLNEEIRDLAGLKHLCLVDLYREFAAEDGFMQKGSTIDGVHLSTKSYARWRALVFESVAACIWRAAGKEIPKWDRRLACPDRRDACPTGRLFLPVAFGKREVDVGAPAPVSGAIRANSGGAILS